MENAKRACLFIASALHQVFACLYNNVDDSQNAIDEYLKAIKIAESVDNKEELSLDYMSLSGEYMSADKLDSAFILENKAWMYAYQSNYKIYLGTILETIGDIYFQQNNYDSAGKYYHDAITASIEQTNLKDEMNAFLAASRLKRATGEIDSSVYYANKALVTSQTFGVPSGKQRAYNALYLCYKLMHKTDSAFVYLEIAKHLGDSLNEADRIKTNQY